MSITTWQQLGALVKDGESLTDDQLEAFTRVAGRWIAPWYNGANWNSQNYELLRVRAAEHKLRCGVWMSPEHLPLLPYAEADTLLVLDHPGHDYTSDFPTWLAEYHDGMRSWDIAVRVPTLYAVDWDAIGLQISALPVWRAVDYLQGDGLLTPQAQMAALRKVLGSDGSDGPIPRIELPLVHGVLGTGTDALRIELLDVLDAKLDGYGLGIVIDGLENLGGDTGEDDSLDRLRSGDWALLASQAGRLWLA